MTLGAFEIKTLRINPRTGKNWEGAGVKPDLEVPADLALEAALEHYRTRAKTAQRPD